VPLDTGLRDALVAAIDAYDFPCVTYDFSLSIEREHHSMRSVEEEIKRCLLSNNIEIVKNGLSNVLYWGYSRIGYRDYRVNEFREKVTSGQLSEAQQLFRRLKGPGVVQIEKLCLPQFSGLSFISKVRMFLNPSNYVALDLKLMTLLEEIQQTIFHGATLRPNATTIRVTRSAEKFYELWCDLCRRIAQENFDGTDVRAVDIERAIFYLVGTDQSELATEILTSACKHLTMGGNL
jgi:hypothetical protein